MSKAGKGDSVDAGAVGSQHPVPENIPHLSSPINSGAASAIPKHLGIGNVNAPAGTAAAGLQAAANAVPQGFQAGSPVKESSFLHRETLPSDTDETPAQSETAAPAAATTTPATEPLTAGGVGIPIRR